MERAILVGERIYFRPIEREDVHRGWHDWINDHEIRENLDGVFPVNKEELERYWEASVPPECVMFAVCDKETGAYFGNARISSIDWINRRCSFGRMIGLADYRGKGYGTEILGLILEFAFMKLGMNRVETGVVATNEGSIRSNEKALMIREGVQRQVLWKDGAFQDVVLFAMTREDYDQHRGAGSAGG